MLNTIIKFDLFINNKITELWSPALTKIMVILTDAGSPENLLILSAFLIIFFIFPVKLLRNNGASKKNFYSAFFVFFSMAGGALIHILLKEIIGRERPENSLIAKTDFSMPSGHATMAIIFFSLLIYLFKDKIKNKFLKYLFIALNIILIISIGFSRIYLNVHWFSDVLAGYGLGLFWLTLLILIFKTIIGIFNKSLEMAKIFIDKIFNNL